MAVPFLRGLHGAEWPIDLVVSRPDTRRRRNADAEPSPVKAAALDLGLPVSDDPSDVATSGADLAIVVAYGRIIKPCTSPACPAGGGRPPWSGRSWPATSSPASM